MAVMFCGFTDSELMICDTETPPPSPGILILADAPGGVVRRVERLGLAAQPFVSLELGAVTIRGGLELAPTEEQDGRLQRRRAGMPDCCV